MPMQISSLQAAGASDLDLEKRLAEIDEAIAANDFRAANIRAGYVYAISNRGAFGGDVVKIALTRRLEPTERVRELSGASVPFALLVAVYTVVPLLAVGAILVAFGPGGVLSEHILQLVFIGLAGLTVPHMMVVTCENRQRRAAGAAQRDTSPI